MAWQVKSGEFTVTLAEVEIAREREHDPHCSQEERDDYYQLIRFFKGSLYYRDAVARALNRIREKV